MNDIRVHQNLLSALKGMVDVRSKTESGFSFGKLADDCRIQRSYISQVLHRRARLSSDQIFLIGRRVELSDEEMEYLFLLNDIEVTSLSSRKDLLETKRRRIQSEFLTTESHLKRSENDFPDELATIYYSNPNLPILHMYLTCSQYAAAPEMLREKLRMSDEMFKSGLGTLKRLGIIEVKTDQIQVKKTLIHLPGDSHLSKINAASFRQLSIGRIWQDPPPPDYFFTATISADEDSRLELKSMFLEFLKRVSNLVERAESKSVYQLNFDLFEL